MISKNDTVINLDIDFCRNTLEISNVILVCLSDLEESCALWHGY